VTFRRTTAHVVLLACALLTGCGKKGPPLPPLQRLPVAPPDLSVARIDQDVYVQFKVPTVNVDGVGPADVARVELYAISTDRAPQARTPEALRRLATLVASEAVRQPLPPPPPPNDGEPPPPAAPPLPGIDQGATVVVRETLTPEMRVAAPIPDDADRTRRQQEELEVPRPLVAPLETAGVQRYYFAVAVSARGRYGPLTAVVPAPLGPTSGPPGPPELAVAETSMTLTWAAPPDARGGEDASSPDVLPSKPIVPGPPPTTYDVYEVPREAAANASPAVPVALTPAPVAGREFTKSDITLGVERCFVVRAVDIVAGVHVRGPASEMVCASFADTFAPAPARNLEAIATIGVIALLWEPSEAKDLAGYLVLRAEVGGATLTPLTPEPMAVTTYRDDTARPGVRYTYAVVAVDKAGNRSPESNRVEETARQ
jgi:predicted small lipoprotein YifL